MESLTSLRAGRPWPLGAHWDEQGVNVAVSSANADAVRTLRVRCRRPTGVARSALPGRTHDVLHGCICPTRPGLIYGLRARAVAARTGHRFNPHKLLLDPYAREIVRPLRVARRALTPNGRTAFRMDLPITPSMR
jgi:glycogen operon protein